jgi:hypothetical protein
VALSTSGHGYSRCKIPITPKTRFSKVNGCNRLLTINRAKIKRTMPTPRISFGDKVAIVATDCTEALGIVGQTGIVHGVTSPSVTGVKVVGETIDDYAIAVNSKASRSHCGLPKAY